MTDLREGEMIRLLYRSCCEIPGSDSSIEAQVDDILLHSRHNNVAAGITGALMLTASQFIQVLEGPRGAVEETFERICGDLRHRDVHLIELSEIDERAFGGFSMGRVCADGHVQALFRGLEQHGPSEQVSVAAGEAVKLMVALLRTGPSSAGQPERLSA